jgi:NAD(P)-dependent dehydrogenase (short-subunit alcohol dehydrogenase family)
MHLDGSSAIVVGGAGGLGEATVRRLVAAGSKVLIADLADEHGQALADELGDAAYFQHTDVLDDQSVGDAVAAAAELGPLRISVDTHGGPAGGKTVDRNHEPLPMENFKLCVDVFLNGTFNVLRQAAAQMSRNEPLDTGERGICVNTASVAGYDGCMGQASYAAAKGGIIGMTLPIARDLSSFGIRVVTIAPGVFATPAYGEALEQVEAEWGSNVPFPKRMGQPDEYAHMVIAAAENPYLNGEVIRLDAALRFQLKGSRT